MGTRSKRARQLVIGLAATLAAALIPACSNPLVIDLVADTWSVTRYVNYAPVVIKNVVNRSGRPYQAAVITATCYNDQLESLTSEFRSQAFSIEPDELIPTVTLDHVGGWPYFINFKVFCRFSSYSELFPLEPNPAFEARK